MSFLFSKGPFGGSMFALRGLVNFNFSNFAIWFCLHCCHCRKDKWMVCQDELWNVLLKTDTSGFWASYTKIYSYTLYYIVLMNRIRLKQICLHFSSAPVCRKSRANKFVRPFRHFMPVSLVIRWLQVPFNISQCPEQQNKTAMSPNPPPKKRFNETPPLAFSLLRALTSTWRFKKWCN